MLGIAKAFAGSACAAPAIFHSRESPPIEIGCGLRVGAGADHLFVENCEDGENRDRQEEPVARYVLCKIEPEDNDRGGSYRQFRVAEPDMLALPSRNRRDMDFQAPCVFLSRIKHLCPQPAQIVYQPNPAAWCERR